MAKDNRQRLFFALWPDVTTRKALRHTAQPISGSPGRLQHPLDLHMTLVFLGMVESERLACIEDAASHIRCEPFTLSIDRVGYWKRPRILWCGPSQSPAPLNRLVADLQDGLSACGFVPEKRHFLPHVTLARKASALELAEVAHSCEWPVDCFVLVASDTGVAPPRYKILKKWAMDS